MSAYQDLGAVERPAVSRGWDQEAARYRRLPAENRVFALGHQLMYRLMERLSNPLNWDGQKLLDFNCGSGNDFPFFLSRGFRVVGCDGAVQMLEQARRNHPDAYADGRLRLWHGQAEDLQAGTFPEGRFDWIYATTGGFSYVDDAEFLRQHQELYKLLRPGGRLLTAHLTPFCLGDTFYHFLKGHPRMAVRRWPGQLEVRIGGQKQRMYLRSYTRLRQLLGREARYFPVLALTPPYQTGYRPSEKTLRRWRKREFRLLSCSSACHFSDQVAVYRQKPLGNGQVQ